MSETQSLSWRPIPLTLTPDTRGPGGVWCGSNEKTPLQTSSAHTGFPPRGLGRRNPGLGTRWWKTLINTFEKTLSQQDRYFTLNFVMDGISQ